MLKDLDIKISKEILGDEVINCVNARDLYKHLGIKKDFSSWMKSQISSLGFEENYDYIILLPLKGEQNKKSAHNIKEYIINTETAKHIAMASRTEKGKEVRNYFIQIEKEYKKLLKDIFQLSPNINSIDYLNIKVLASKIGKHHKILNNERSKNIQTFIKNYLKFEQEEIISANFLYKIYCTYTSIKKEDVLEFSTFVGYMALNNYHLSNIKLKYSEKTFQAYILRKGI